MDQRRADWLHLDGYRCKSLTKSESGVRKNSYDAVRESLGWCICCSPLATPCRTANVSVWQGEGMRPILTDVVWSGPTLCSLKSVTAISVAMPTCPDHLAAVII